MFKTGNPVSGDSFIDRKKYLRIFKTYINENQSFMIKAPRRFGKTSVVKHLLEDKDEYTYVYVDIKVISNLKSLANRIIDKAYSISKIDNFLYKAKNSMFELIKNIQSVKIDDIAELTIKHTENKEIDDVEYFLHSLDVMNNIAIKKNINIKFVLDEFQDILKISDNKILDKARSVMQHHNNITYIFLGSIESIMTKIFENKSSAFFHFASIVELSPLDVNELYNYSKKVFDEKKIICDDLKYLLSFLNGHPDYSLQVLQRLYFTSLSNDTKIITFDDTHKILIEVILNNKAYIDELISKSKQKKYHLEVLTNIANNNKSILESKVLYNVHSSLEDMGLIKRISQANYVISDIFLNIYLQQKTEHFGVLDYKNKKI